MVMIWRSLFWFICSIIAARVVDFPLPVGPVTRISPRGSIAILYKMVGIFSSSSVGIVEFKSRIVAAIFFCWRNTLTRWRHPSDVRIAKSASFPFAKCLFCGFVCTVLCLCLHQSAMHAISGLHPFGNVDVGRSAGSRFPDDRIHFLIVKFYCCHIVSSFLSLFITDLHQFFRCCHSFFYQDQSALFQGSHMLMFSCIG